LTNEEVIAVNQDPLGKQADLIDDEKTPLDHKQIWGGDLSNKRFVLICLNRGNLESTFSLHFDKLFSGKKVTKIREIIDHVDIDVPKSNILKTKTVAVHAISMYVITLDS